MTSRQQLHLSVFSSAQGAHSGPRAELGCSLTARQRSGCLYLPAGVPPREEEKGVHHGEMVSVPPCSGGRARPTRGGRSSWAGRPERAQLPRPLGPWGGGAGVRWGGWVGAAEQDTVCLLSPCAQRTEVPDQSGEGVGTSLQELLHPGRPAPGVSKLPHPPGFHRVRDFSRPKPGSWVLPEAPHTCVCHLMLRKDLFHPP